ncbi:hypothetical protein ACH5RR_041157 [Cinchona calisaya]|uniref:Uncharacterized protein n=1 Tax=Cinchona calisaya TaxID=153742 RepID=A0ABD2XW49_9GENT
MILFKIWMRLGIRGLNLRGGRQGQQDRQLSPLGKGRISVIDQKLPAWEELAEGFNLVAGFDGEATLELMLVGPFKRKEGPSSVELIQMVELACTLTKATPVLEKEVPE